MKLLALDAAGGHGSVALWDGRELRERSAAADRGPGGQLLAMASELLAESGLALGALDALAFGRGPGAFTGLRLAASVTQGLAYAAALPVIPVSDLRALAQRALAGPGAPPRVLVCQDARMGEVYWAGFEAADGHARAATPEGVARPEQMLASARAWLGSGAAGGAGTGFNAYAPLAAMAARLSPLLAAIDPRAQEIARLALHDGPRCAVAPEQALPVYLRDDVAVPAAGDSR